MKRKKLVYYLAKNYKENKFYNLKEEHFFATKEFFSSVLKICLQEKDYNSSLLLIRYSQKFTTKQYRMMKLYSFYYSHQIVREQKFWVEAMNYMIETEGKEGGELLADDVLQIFDRNLRSMLYCLRSKDAVLNISKQFLSEGTIWEKHKVKKFYLESIGTY